jgi:integrase
VKKGTPGATKVKRRSAKWYGQFMDADGKRQQRPLCTDKAAAKQMLNALDRDVQRGKVGLTDPNAAHRKTPIEAHVVDYEAHVRNKGATEVYLKEMMRELRTAISHAGARSIDDLTPDAIERFLGILISKGTGTTTRNKYLKTAKAFTRWCRKRERIEKDPLDNLALASGATRRKRRALTEDELARLLKAAMERPLVEARKIRRGPNKGEPMAKIGEKTRASRERVGWERCLIYKTLVCTGLRRGSWSRSALPN